MMSVATRPKPSQPESSQECRAPEYKPAGKLYGKRALVTGGGSGVGRAVAALFAKEGADVALVYPREEESEAQKTRRAVEDAGRKAVLIPGDVHSAEFCRKALERAVHGLGGLDILVNNAACPASKDDPREITEEEWAKTFRTSIDAYFFLTKAALPRLKAGSCIINTGFPAYGSTKGAIHAFTKSLALNLGPDGIRVNCVSPGPARPPVGRPPLPEEIAPVFVFLASNADSSYISGEVLTLAGGEIPP